MLMEYIEHYNWKILTAVLQYCWLFVHIHGTININF